MKHGRSVVDAYRIGDSGEAVAEIIGKLQRLGLLDDRPRQVFDDETANAVRGFQQQRGLTVDGVVGPQTYRAIDDARWRLGDRLLTYVPAHPLTGDDVVHLQSRLQELGFAVARIDGIFGADTQRAVTDLQRNTGLPADGTCGPSTFKALDRIRPMATGGRPDALRSAEAVRQAGPRLSGKTVVIDPGHGGYDYGWEGHGLREADIAYDLAARIEGRLGATGVRAYLSRGRDQGPDELTRAAFANETDANLCVSLHTDGSLNPAAQGVATYFYGNDLHGASSSVGDQFAGLVQREIVARTDLLDGRTHAKTWDLLRRTKMPAVRLEIGYVTNPHDASRLADPAFRDVVAEAIVVAIQRVYLPPEQDAATGMLRLGQLI
jgi:N-acetylmuramoyl-L-alanine amidase